MTVGHIPFEDDRISFEQWKELRPSTPFLSLPILTVDGSVMAQSVAIERYLAKLAGLYPSDPLAALKVDEIRDTLVDVMMAVFKYRGDDKEKQREERERFVREDVPRYLGGLEKRLKVFGGTDGWAVGEEMTMADLAIFAMGLMFKSGIIDHVPQDALHQYDRLKAAYEKVAQVEEVKAWYEKYPVKSGI
eukprot:GFKZ01001915.1.p1 GENE.GFKZ01001915.1~~GFKZ01001915.1.p1  ORF type:complete len:190 (+),score=48.29 GFKZ01001915.1:460-1029(+)